MKSSKFLKISDIFQGFPFQEKAYSLFTAAQFLRDYIFLKQPGKQSESLENFRSAAEAQSPRTSMLCQTGNVS